jgi:hypothetical protein
MAPYDEFKRLRNKLRKFYPEQMISRCVELLRRNESRGRDLGFAPPWTFMLMIKWTLMHGEFISPDRRQLTDKDWNDLLLIWEDLQRSIERQHNRRTECEWFLYFRKLAYQQFCYQWELTASQVARQRLLFGNLEANHRFKQRFAAITGLDIDHFIEYEMMLYSLVLGQNPDHVTVESFNSVSAAYPAGTADRFLSMLSWDLESAKRFLENDPSQLGDVSLQFYEQTAFRKCPLLNRGANYTWYSKHLLRHSLQNLIYDLLRDDNSNNFMDKFGAVFQNYLELGLTYAEIPFLTENTLEALLPGTDEIVDFLIVDDGATIFVDAKGVEMRTLGHVSPDPRIVSDKVKTSVIKGIRQAFKTAMRIGEMAKIGDLELGLQDRFALVVTYKDHFLGPGRVFYECIAKDRLDQLVHECGDVEWIPFKNIYFLSVDEYELVIQSVKERKLGIAELLRMAANGDSDMLSGKLLLSQYLSGEYRPEFMPDYLVKEFEDLGRLIQDRLP